MAQREMPRVEDMTDHTHRPVWRRNVILVTCLRFCDVSVLHLDPISCGGLFWPAMLCSAVKYEAVSMDKSCSAVENLWTTLSLLSAQITPVLHNHAV